jgi:hypothetical protein
MAARCIVCEKTGKWAAALRWASSGVGFRLYETRSLMDCRRELEQSPNSFLCLEATERSSENVIRFLWEIRRSYPRAHAIVMTTQSLAHCEDWFREAGAWDVALSPRRADILARLAQWHLDHLSRPRQSPREMVWSRLPWANA